MSKRNKVDSNKVGVAGLLTYFTGISLAEMAQRRKWTAGMVSKIPKRNRISAKK
ncbi:MAG: hypothetical protein AB8B99_03850 [Phormidesmis sp.]